MGRKGETKKVVEAFSTAVTSVFTSLGSPLQCPEENALYKTLKALSDLPDLSQRARKETNCDEAMAAYCIAAAKLASPAYFHTLAKIVVAYRECVNRYGWKKLFEESPGHATTEGRKDSDSPRVSTCFSSSVEQQVKMRSEYCATVDPDRLPEVANEFVLLFLKEYDLGIVESDAISVLINMCDWLYSNGYTQTQMRPIKSGGYAR